MEPAPQPPNGPINWEASWSNGRTPWDLRGISPPLQALAAQGGLKTLDLPEGPVAVPGCGRGHDLRVFAQQGFQVVGFDVVPQAVREARQLLALNGVTEGVDVQCRDVFGLDGEHDGQYALVYDYTCFCALPHVFRRAYGQVVTKLLQPGGVFLHLAFPVMPDRDPLQGPPFRILESDMRAAFGPGLDLISRRPVAASAPDRQGAEEWFIWRKPAAGSS